MPPKTPKAVSKDLTFPTVNMCKLHKQPYSMICLHSNCHSCYKLICTKCKKQKHFQHPNRVILLKDFYQMLFINKMDFIQNSLGFSLINIKNKLVYVSNFRVFILQKESMLMQSARAIYSIIFKILQQKTSIKSHLQLMNEDTQHKNSEQVINSLNQIRKYILFNPLQNVIRINSDKVGVLKVQLQKYCESTQIIINDIREYLVKIVEVMIEQQIEQQDIEYIEHEDVDQKVFNINIKKPNNVQINEKQPKYKVQQLEEWFSLLLKSEVQKQEGHIQSDVQKLQEEIKFKTEIVRNIRRRSLSKGQKNYSHSDQIKQIDSPSKNHSNSLNDSSSQHNKSLDASKNSSKINLHSPKSPKNKYQVKNMVKSPILNSKSPKTPKIRSITDKGNLTPKSHSNLSKQSGFNAFNKISPKNNIKNSQQTSKSQIKPNKGLQQKSIQNKHKSVYKSKQQNSLGSTQLAYQLIEQSEQEQLLNTDTVFKKTFKKQNQGQNQQSLLLQNQQISTNEVIKQLNIRIQQISIDNSKLKQKLEMKNQDIFRIEQKYKDQEIQMEQIIKKLNFKIQILQTQLKQHKQKQNNNKKDYQNLLQNNKQLLQNNKQLLQSNKQLFQNNKSFQNSQQDIKNLLHQIQGMKERNVVIQNTKTQLLIQNKDLNAKYKNQNQKAQQLNSKIIEQQLFYEKEMKQNINKYEKSEQQLKTEIQQLKSANFQLSDRLQITQKQFNRLNSLNNTQEQQNINEENNNLKDLIKKIEKKLQLSADQTITLRDQIFKTIKQKQNLLSKISILQNNATELQQQNKQIYALLQQKNQALKNVQVIISQNTQSIQQKQQILTNKQKHLRQTLESIYIHQCSIQQKQQIINRKQQEIIQKQQIINSLNSNLLSSSIRMKQMEKIVQDYQQLFKNNTETIKANQQEIQTYQHLIKQKQTTILLQQDKIKQKQIILTQYQKQLEKVQNQCKQALKKYQDLQNQIKEKDILLSMKQTLLKESQIKMTDWFNKVKHSQIKINQLQNKLKENQKNINQIEESSELREGQKIWFKNQQISKLQIKVKQLNSKINQYQKTIRQLEQLLEISYKTIQNKKNEQKNKLLSPNKSPITSPNISPNRSPNKSPNKSNSFVALQEQNISLLQKLKKAEETINKQKIQEKNVDKQHQKFKQQLLQQHQYLKKIYEQQKQRNEHSAKFEIKNFIPLIKYKQLKQWYEISIRKTQQMKEQLMILKDQKRRLNQQYDARIKDLTQQNALLLEKTKINYVSTKGSSSMKDGVQPLQHVDDNLSSNKIDILSNQSNVSQMPSIMVGKYSQIRSIIEVITGDMHMLQQKVKQNTVIQKVYLKQLDRKRTENRKLKQEIQQYRNRQRKTGGVRTQRYFQKTNSKGKPQKNDYKVYYATGFAGSQSRISGGGGSSITQCQNSTNLPQNFKSTQTKSVLSNSSSKV